MSLSRPAAVSPRVRQVASQAFQHPTHYGKACKARRRKLYDLCHPACKP